MKNKQITQSARGEDCTVMLFPYCNQNPETTVFAHAPSIDKGMGIKSPDHWGAYACSTCHDIIDGKRRADDIAKIEILKCFYNGVYLTQKRLIQLGLIKIKGINFE